MGIYGKLSGLVELHKSTPEQKAKLQSMYLVIIDHCELNQTYSHKSKDGKWHTKGTTTWQKMVISKDGVSFYDSKN